MPREALAPKNYGASELKGFYRFNLIRGFLLSGMLYFSGLSLFWILPHGQREPLHQKPMPGKKSFTLNPSPPTTTGRTSFFQPGSGSQRVPTPVFQSGMLPEPVPVIDVDPADGSPGSQDSVSDFNGEWRMSDESGGSVSEVFERTVEQLPLPIKTVPPQYPVVAIRAEVEGTVSVRVFVSREGRVQAAFVQASDSPLLEKAALDAAVQWQFSPAMMGARPVPIWMSIPFTFKLSNR